MEKRYHLEEKKGFTLIHNPDGPVLGMARVRLVERDGAAFKDFAGTGELLPYADWRLSPEQRAEDLARRLSPEEIAGLMLWSSHQMVPFVPGLPFKGHYNGREYEPGMDPAALTDEQTGFVRDQKIRNILLNYAESADSAARWSNNLQRLAEDSTWGIPVCISSDPRHAAGKKGAEFSGEGRDVSRWPEGMGMAAAFDPELVKEFASVVAREYRALGIALALGPQIDRSTDPRWMRYEDTFGGDLELVTEMARNYCDGLQTTPGAPGGWGRQSVAAMVKHWPGGGTGEGGRDAHYAYGKFAVFPGNRMEEHMKPFTEGAFRLSGPTGKAASVMPYYTVSWDQDRKNGENVGNSYSEYIISDLLRKGQGYEGVVCTDWGITDDPDDEVSGFGSRCFGVEHLSEGERYLRILENGVDMFGGCNRAEPVMESYRIGCQRHGGEAMKARMELSARRILTIMFRLGLFENPYLDPAESAATVGCREFVEAGREAQRRSVVLLKNKSVLPLKKGTKVWVPDRHIGPGMTFFRTPEPARDVIPLEGGGEYLELVSDPDQAEAAVVFIESPICECYSIADREQGGNGYLPITLQYRPYTALSARKTSIAGGDFREPDPNRSYFGKTGTARNEQDLDNILNARKAMGDKPVVVVMQLHNGAVVSEFEGAADGILAHFGVENQVLLQILTGEKAPGGRLPIILPKDMDTVERHCEDVFDDLEAYEDEAGNRYGFGFGLSY